MKSLLKLGKALSKAEQKLISGGDDPEECGYNIVCQYDETCNNGVCIVQ